MHKAAEFRRVEVSGRAMSLIPGMLAVVLLLILGACAPAPPPAPLPPLPPPVLEDLPPLCKSDWEHIPGWDTDKVSEAMEAFKRSCTVLKRQPGWAEVCTHALEIEQDDAAVRAFFQHNFTPWLLQNADGSTQGTITGYYVPDIDASREPDAIYRYPILQRPADMLVIDLASVYPELGKYRLRGRVEGGRVVPYWDRAAIEADRKRIAADPLFWVRDPVELFFLHIQGSGRVNLTDGSQVMINYADQNGHPYRSIGKLLLDRNEMTREQMSMQNIARWGQQNPDKLDQLLNENPSYVFFAPQPMTASTPPGAQGVPLTPERSLAVDRSYVPMGAPVFIDTRWPRVDKPLQRLMVAQDTGGAIKGRVRADFFWGVGEGAGWQAGAMKYPGRMWILLPHTLKPELR
ncbi:MAG: MltA domain-containing protein [Desulfuromonadaceae bacterium]|nr:MltA domain-containing protein [Desulfuromonadaceae bacterium]